MSVNSVLDIERLGPVDVAANVELSRSVGWKDVESEWRVLHAAGEVRGVRRDRRVVAQGAFGDYGNSAVVAKMIVATEMQRRGIGARLLDGFLSRADERGIPVGLCATDQGRPLYESRKFSVSGELTILVGTPELGRELGGSVVPMADAEQAVELERRFARCDRSAMLRARFREANAKYLLVDEGSGFGLCDPRNEYSVVGPIWAESEAGARLLALALFRAVPGSVRVDVPLKQVNFRRWLDGLGLKEVSRRVEMARGAERLPWQVPQRFALATQAWG